MKHFSTIKLCNDVANKIMGSIEHDLHTMFKNDFDIIEALNEGFFIAHSHIEDYARYKDRYNNKIEFHLKVKFGYWEELYPKILIEDKIYGALQ